MALQEVDLLELEGRGLFRWASPDRLDELRAEVRETGWPFPEATGRAFHADAEELAEEGVVDFLARVASFLGHEGVTTREERAQGKSMRSRDVMTGRIVDALLPGKLLSLSISLARGGELVAVTDVIDGTGERYDVALGDRVFNVYAPEHRPDAGWLRATSATVDILDHLLSRHDSSDRAWAVSPGENDLQIVFAAPALAEVANRVLDGHSRLWGAAELAEGC